MKWNSLDSKCFLEISLDLVIYEKNRIDAGIIITLDEMAYQRWAGEAKPYESARASFLKLINFLEGDYSSIPMYLSGTLELNKIYSIRPTEVYPEVS